jgi:hypothetical protein
MSVLACCRDIEPKLGGIVLPREKNRLARLVPPRKEALCVFAAKILEVS